MRQLALVSFVLLAACGDDGGKPPEDAKAIDAKVIDAPVADAQVIDAPPDAPPTVTAVTCPADASALPKIMTQGNMYMPTSVTIAPDDIVQFIMPAAHNVIPDTSLPTDSGLNVGFGETTCLKFTETGTFNFKCMPHNFKGHVTVQ